MSKYTNYLSKKHSPVITIVGETEKAYCVAFKAKKYKGSHWVPKSQCVVHKKEANQMTGYEQQLIKVALWFWKSVLQPKLRA